MQRFVTRSIHYIFYTLLFLVPLILFPKTSEIFEFNKMVLVYLTTALITGLWFLKMIINKKFIFKRTPADIPLLFFLAVMGLSTFFSIDPRTSLFGHYSRFNGGLSSFVCFSILYWAYISNMSKEQTKLAIKVLFISTIISSVWAIMEHFGRSFSCLVFANFRTFDTSCWVQDVQNRVYSTFGQPNWLAAWLVALIPLTWASASIFKKFPNSKTNFSNFLTSILHPTFYILLSLLFFLTLLFTKSRSGILAFAVSYVIFWGYYLISYQEKARPKFFYFILHTSYFILLALIVGTPWTKSQSTVHSPSITAPPALETGGTESGEIRKIVWKGAVDIWKANPVIGTGPETFAYSYYNFRPASHNLTSEWDFLYNKAHNEYLNIAATTGTIGLLSYLLVILTSLTVFLKNFQFSIFNFQSNPNLKIYKLNNSIKIKNYKLEIIALLAGYASILVTNFFGFSTVPTNILFFLFPAFAVTLLGERQEVKVESQGELNSKQKVLILILLPFTFYLLLLTIKYWLSDYSYALGKRLSDSGNYEQASEILDKLVTKSPKEPVYWDELSSAHANLAIFHSEKNEEELAKQLADESYRELQIAMELSPANVTLKRKAATRLVGLTAIDQQYINQAREILDVAVKLAPTDAKLHYNLALTYLRTGDYNRAVEIVQKTIELKPDYELAHYALALIYIDSGRTGEAKAELIYILENINPNNIQVQRELNELQ